MTCTYRAGRRNWPHPILTSLLARRSLTLAGTKNPSRLQFWLQINCLLLHSAAERGGKALGGRSPEMSTNCDSKLKFVPFAFLSVAKFPGQIDKRPASRYLSPCNPIFAPSRPAEQRSRPISKITIVQSGQKIIPGICGRGPGTAPAPRWWWQRAPAAICLCAACVFTKGARGVQAGLTCDAESPAGPSVSLQLPGVGTPPSGRTGGRKNAHAHFQRKKKLPPAEQDVWAVWMLYWSRTQPLVGACSHPSATHSLAPRARRQTPLLPLVAHCTPHTHTVEWRSRTAHALSSDPECALSRKATCDLHSSRALQNILFFSLLAAKCVCVYDRLSGSQGPVVALPADTSL